MRYRIRLKGSGKTPITTHMWPVLLNVYRGRHVDGEAIMILTDGKVERKCKVPGNKSPNA
jgi:hypothetical protein